MAVPESSDDDGGGGLDRPGTDAEARLHSLPDEPLEDIGIVVERDASAVSPGTIRARLRVDLPSRIGDQAEPQSAARLDPGKERADLPELGWLADRVDVRQPSPVGPGRGLDQE
jgi:hypothetical protein